VPAAQLPSGGPGSATWGSITGDLTEQTDLLTFGDELIAAHESAGNPHAGYETTAEADARGTAHLASTAHTTPGGVTAQDPGTVSLPTASFGHFYRRVALSSTERMTLAGTARVLVEDRTESTPSVGVQCYWDAPFTLKHRAFLVQYQRIELDKGARATLQGASRVLITDFTAPQGRIVITGSSARA
jgi:hypothetical protein